MSAVINSNTQFTDESTGELLVNGFIYIGLDGLDAKLNPATIYSDRDLTTVLLNPQRTGADGRSVNKIWVDGKYSMKVEDSANVQKLNTLSLGELTQTGNTILTNVQGADALTADASPTITALVDRQVYILTAVSTNTTAMTLTIDGTPTWPIKKQHDKAMVAGDIEGNQVLAVIFNDTDKVFELMTNSAIAPVDVATTQTITGDKTLTGTTVISGATTLSGVTTDITGTATLSGDSTLSGDITLSGSILGATPLVFEGATDDEFETTLAVEDPTADNILTFPNKTGTLATKEELSKLATVTGIVAGNDLTAGFLGHTLDFRDATLSDGAVTTIQFGDLTLVVPDGATLGAIDGQLTRVALLAMNNAGTAEPAIVNIAGGVNLNEEGVISTTALSTGSDSNNVIYSTTARSNVAYKVVGILEFTQATAGTYATSPSLKQGMGGNALTSMSSLGYGQTMQDLSGSRSLSTTYYNTTGKPIFIAVSSISSAGSPIEVTVNGVTVFGTAPSPSTRTGLFAVIGVGEPYSVAVSGSSSVVWGELR